MRQTRLAGKPVWAAECKCGRFWLAPSERQARVLLDERPCHRSKR